VAQFELILGHFPARNGQPVSLLSIFSRHQILMQPQALQLWALPHMYVVEGYPCSDLLVKNLKLSLYLIN
jgi:hypothetical protein